MSRARYLFLVLLVWAAIYLPRLGTLEIKIEEGRRILPAVTMLETGNYLVPQIGSEPYFRKPPLVCPDGMRAAVLFCGRTKAIPPPTPTLSRSCRPRRESSPSSLRSRLP